MDPEGQQRNLLFNKHFVEGASRSDVPITVVHTTYWGRESLGRGHKQCFQERLLMFKKINIFYGVQFAVSLGFLNDYLTKFRSDKKNRTVFEGSRFIFATTLSVDRNAIKLFQFVMNKDWLLFFYPGKYLYFSIYSYSKPYLCLTVEKNGIKCWIFSRAETFSHKVAAILKWRWLVWWRVTWT